jgi:hypothetical protein
MPGIARAVAMQHAVLYRPAVLRHMDASDRGASR